MIRGFQHKGLKRLFETGKHSGIQAQHANKLRLILGHLQAAQEPKDMNPPGLRLHELKVTRSGTWTVDVSGNWRITFQFAGENVTDVDYEEYH